MWRGGVGVAGWVWRGRCGGVEWGRCGGVGVAGRDRHGRLCDLRGCLTVISHKVSRPIKRLASRVAGCCELRAPVEVDILRERETFSVK